MTQSRKVLKDLKLLEVVPVPKSTTTFKSFITPRGTARDTGGNSQFTAPRRVPTVNEVRKLIGLLCADATYTCMNNHFYTIGGEVRVQSDGGSIGSDLTGEVARVYMLLWDQRLINKCKSLGINLDSYSRYVDDQLLIMRTIGKGWSYNSRTRRMEFSKLLEQSCTLSDSERTARVIAEIANSLDEGIQVTVDLPERNEDGRLPVLDLKV